MNTMRHCPSCGSTLPADAPAGLCPVCLLKTDPAATWPTEGPSGGPAPTITVKPLTQGPSAEPASTLTIGPAAFARVHYFGDYELLEEIARGGMGVVWKARQSSLNRTVALKMILAGKLASEAEVQRFRREAEAAANLQHPNIVAIHEVGEHEGQHYYSMDYVAGRDLGSLVRESGPLPPARAAECVKTLAEAVHFAHQRGTLHRDLKPQNVLIDAAGVPRITDFGLAKFIGRDESLTQNGVVMGSPSYMSPEQAAGHLDQVGPHSDVYSLGAVLYELLTGRPPFRAETPAATMRQVMESEPAAPRKLNAALPPDLETICLKCLEKNPARRYHSARALAEELGRFLNHEPIQAIPVSTVRKAESWLRRHPWPLVAAASSASIVLMGLLYWQFERGKFLENRLLADQALPHPGSMAEEPVAWEVASVLLLTTIVWALGIFKCHVLGVPKSVVTVDIRACLSAVFRQYVRGEKGDLLGRLAGGRPPQAGEPAYARRLWADQRRRAWIRGALPGEDHPVQRVGKHTYAACMVVGCVVPGLGWLHSELVAPVPHSAGLSETRLWHAGPDPVRQAKRTVASGHFRRRCRRRHQAVPPDVPRRFASGSEPFRRKTYRRTQDETSGEIRSAAQVAGSQLGSDE